MTDRDNPGGGGMTGATGDLTPDVPDTAFDPGERREVEGPDRARITHAQATGAPAQSGDGSEHGLSPNDPAYRMDETHPPAAGEDVSRHEPRGETRIGGDDLTESEERF